MKNSLLDLSNIYFKNNNKTIITTYRLKFKINGVYCSALTLDLKSMSLQTEEATSKIKRMDETPLHKNHDILYYHIKLCKRFRLTTQPQMDCALKRCTRFLSLLTFSTVLTHFLYFRNNVFVLTGE